MSPRRLVLQGLLVLLLSLSCSCAYRPTKVHVATGHGLRLSPEASYVVSTSSTGKIDDSSGSQTLSSLLHAELSALSVPTSPASKASYMLALECRDFPASPRNQPPLAPGSRLWYQRRFYAPTFARTNPEPSTSGARQLYLRMYKNDSAPASNRLPLWEAKIRCSDSSDAGIRMAVRSLVNALNTQRIR